MVNFFLVFILYVNTPFFIQFMATAITGIGIFYKCIGKIYL